MNYKFILVIIAFAFTSFARISIVVFPLSNEVDDSLFEWVACAPAVVAFDQLYSSPEVRVWEPVFMSMVDTSNWSMNDKKKLKLHEERWGWDYAVGGTYFVSADSIRINLRVAHSTVGGMRYSKLTSVGPITSLATMCGSLITEILEKDGIDISEKLLKNISEVATYSYNEYSTYLAGYWFEISKQVNSALSTYSFAWELNHNLPIALCRMAMIQERAGNVKKAKELFDEAVSKKSKSSYIVAQAGMFYIENLSSQLANEFVNTHKSVLEKSSEGYRVLGLSYLLTGEHQRAIASLNRALAMGPVDLETEFVMGQVYLSSGQYDLAIGVFDRLIAFRPDHVRYYSLLGVAYRYAGKIMKSAKILEAGRKLDPNNIPNIINLANTYSALGLYSDAEQLLLQSIELAPEMKFVYLNLGVVYWKMKKYKKAKAMFDKSALMPETVQSALGNEGNMLFITGDIKSAIKVYKQADKAGAKNEAVMYNLGLAYESCGNYKKASEYYGEVLLMSPNRLEVIEKMAHIAELQSNDDEVELLYRKILTIRPDKRNVRLNLIKLLSDSKRYDEAVEFVEDYLNERPLDNEFRVLQPQLYAKMGWYEVAVMHYSELVKDSVFANDANVVLELAKASYNQIVLKNGKKYDKAIYYLKEAEDFFPKDPSIDVMIATIYLRYKKYNDRALEYLKKAQSKDCSLSVRNQIKSLLSEVE